MIAVVGAGAMGCMLAARLIQAGQNVVLLEKSHELVTKINGNGITVESKKGILRKRAQAYSTVSELDNVKTIFIYVKGQDTKAVAQLISPIVNEKTTIVTLQNGWGNAEILSEYFPEEQLVVGLTYDSVKVLDLTHVSHTGFGHTYVGPWSDDCSIERSSEIATLLNKAQLETTVTKEIKEEMWKKLILNAAVLPTAALTRLTQGEMGEEPLLVSYIDSLAQEAIVVANRLGYPIELDERLDRIHALLRNGGKGKPSMLQDVEARRKTEIEFINGAIVREAEKVKADVPLNRAAFALVKGLEKGILPN